MLTSTSPVATATSALNLDGPGGPRAIEPRPEAPPAEPPPAPPPAPQTAPPPAPPPAPVREAVLRPPPRTEAVAFPPRAGRHRLAVQLVTQSVGIGDPDLGVNLAYGGWLADRLAIDVHLSFFPGTSAVFAKASAFGGLRLGIGRGLGHLFGRWDSGIDLYALVGAGVITRTYFHGGGLSSDSRTYFGLQGGAGMSIDLGTRGLGLVLEVADQYYGSGDPLVESGTQEVRFLTGLAFAVDGGWDDDTALSAPLVPLGGTRVALLGSSSVDPSATASPGLALTVAFPITSAVSFEAYLGGAIDAGSRGTFGTLDPNIVGPNTTPYVLPGRGLGIGALAGVQADILRARGEPFFGEAPMQLRVYGVTGVGGGKPIGTSTPYFVADLGLAAEVAFANGFVAAVDVRDFVYTHGPSISHVRAGALIGWRVGG